MRGDSILDSRGQSKETRQQTGTRLAGCRRATNATMCQTQMSLITNERGIPRRWAPTRLHQLDSV
jgi:hypothetical protein